MAVWNDTDKEPVWSEVSTWEMALLNQSDWQAQWIGSAERDSGRGAKEPGFISGKDTD